MYICTGAEFAATCQIFSRKNMNALIKLLAVTAACMCCNAALAQKTGDVFVPISKYIERGDSDALSAWFSDNLEVSIFAKTNDASRNQAKQIMKSFFKSYTPRSFAISHKVGRPNMKYALGLLSAGGEMFQVTIFVGLEDQEYMIQQIKIERID